MKGKILEFWKKYESKIITILGLILIAVISFQGGFLQGKSQQNSPVIIENAEKCPFFNTSNNSSSRVLGEGSETEKDSKENQKTCAFVGSKNSNKYHPPTCHHAKRIKEENKICFSSEQDAESKGYTPSSSCAK